MTFIFICEEMVCVDSPAYFFLPIAASSPMSPLVLAVTHTLLPSFYLCLPFFKTTFPCHVPFQVSCPKLTPLGT